MTLTIVKGITSKVDQQSLSTQNKSVKGAAQSGATSAVSGQLAAGDAAVVKFSRSSDLAVDKIRDPGKAKQMAEDIADRVREDEDAGAHDLSSVDSRGHLGAQ